MRTTFLVDVRRKAPQLPQACKDWRSFWRYWLQQLNSSPKSGLSTLSGTLGCQQSKHLRLTRSSILQLSWAAEQDTKAWGIRHERYIQTQFSPPSSPKVEEVKIGRFLDRRALYLSKPSLLRSNNIISDLVASSSLRCFSSTVPHSTAFSDGTPAVSTSLETEETISHEPSALEETEGLLDDGVMQIAASSEVIPRGLEQAVHSGAWGWTSMPIDIIAGALTSFQSASGLPWWLSIALATVAMRTCLVPLAILQIRKSSQFMAMLPKIALKPDASRTWAEALREFQSRRKAVGAPHPAWFLLVASVQIPLFVTSMLAVRSMAANGHPGFETGGALWFLDLSAPGQGPLGYVLPVLAATSYLANLHVSLRGIQMTSRGPAAAFFVYHTFLEGLAIPSFAAALYMPQAIFMYWITNNLFSISQGLILRNPRVLSALHVRRSLPTGSAEARASPGSSGEASGELRERAARNKALLEKLSADEILKLAAECEAAGDSDGAVLLLRRAATKNPHHYLAAFALGKVLAKKSNNSSSSNNNNKNMNKGHWAEAAAAFLEAASRGRGETEKGAALFAAGVAKSMQGLNDDALCILREAAELRPEHVETLLSLASILRRQGRIAEAREYASRVATFDPKLGDKYLKELDALSRPLTSNG